MHASPPATTPLPTADGDQRRASVERRSATSAERRSPVSFASSVFVRRSVGSAGPPPRPAAQEQAAAYLSACCFHACALLLWLSAGWCVKFHTLLQAVFEIAAMHRALRILSERLAGAGASVPASTGPSAWRSFASSALDKVKLLVVQPKTSSVDEDLSEARLVSFHCGTDTLR